MSRRLIATLFWVALLGFIALDRGWSSAHDRFAEPSALALGSGRVAGAGHCSGSIK